MKAKQKILFIDRDGTLVMEPPVDYQLDSLEKLEFYPAVFRNLYQIRSKTDFFFSMVTNQDGLGTKSFPEDNFWPAHNKIIQAFENEGIRFDAVHIDKSMPEDHAPTRKPGIALLTEYFKDAWDLPGSFVIGDRLTDVQLAANMGCKAIYLKTYSIDVRQELLDAGLNDVCVLISDSWDEVMAFLLAGERSVEINRKTHETDIRVRVDLDGHGVCDISTGLGFFDHMLEQIGKHAGIDLLIHTQGDLHVDEHHTVEDTAIVLGEALSKALGDKRGLERYGYCLPMDDNLCQAVLDFGGRPWLLWDVQFKRERIGDVPTELFLHFFKSLSDAAKMNLAIQAEGDNEHHKIEGIFKAFARAIKMAIRRDVYKYDLPSTKGML